MRALLVLAIFFHSGFTSAGSFPYRVTKADQTLSALIKAAGVPISYDPLPVQCALRVLAPSSLTIEAKSLDIIINKSVNLRYTVDWPVDIESAIAKTLKATGFTLQGDYQRKDINGWPEGMATALNRQGQALFINYRMGPSSSAVCYMITDRTAQRR